MAFRDSAGSIEDREARAEALASSVVDILAVEDSWGVKTSALASVAGLALLLRAEDQDVGDDDVVEEFVGILRFYMNSHRLASDGDVAARPGHSQVTH